MVLLSQSLALLVLSVPLLVAPGSDAAYVWPRPQKFSQGDSTIMVASAIDFQIKGKGSYIGIAKKAVDR
ncbi:hypothetical protein K7432_015600, partial [Basidiobolus ranarum]